MTSLDNSLILSKNPHDIISQAGLNWGYRHSVCRNGSGTIFLFAIKMLWNPKIYHTNFSVWTLITFRNVLIWQADTIGTKQRWDNTKWVFNEVFSQSWQFDGILYKYEIKVWTLDKKSSKLWTVIQQRAANLPFQKVSYGTTSNPSTSRHKTLRNDAIIHCSHGHFLPPVVYFLVSTFW